MADRIDRFFDELQGKRVGLIGCGVSHMDLIRLFSRKGLQLTVFDKRTENELGDKYKELISLGVRLQLGEGYLDRLCDVDVIFRTPGMNYYSPALSRARELGKVVTSEMEVFFDLCPCKKIAVTGSDGKTTTTTLIAELLKAQGKTVHLGGNIGRALLPIIEQIKPEDFAVVELSSFQLISMRQSPDIAVVTNVAPNHLDVHKDMAEYIEAKSNVVRHQNAFSTTVLNLDNETTAEFAKQVRGRLFWFSRRQTPKNGAFLAEDGVIYMMRNDEKHRIMHRDDIKLPGVHNIENYLAAITAVYDFVDVNNIVKVAQSFGGVEHRIELVRELDGVRWYNDSIATSPTRTIAGLNAFDQKLIIIAGGYDKKIPFEPLAPKLIEKAKALILMGVTAPKIEQAVTSCEGYSPDALPLYHAKSMEDAVRIAREIAVTGDVVSLSPACASFDLYPNFEARGRHYKDIVNAL